MSVFGRVVLVTGPESLLADRAVAERLAAARAESPEAELTEVEAAVLDPNTFAELTGGSLFSERQMTVVRDLANLPEPMHQLLLDTAAAPPPDALVLCVHAGGVKGKKLLDGLRKAKVEVIDCPQVKPWEVAGFVSAEARRAGGRIDGETAQLLVDSVGHDLRALSAAVSQLLSDGDGEQITGPLVKRYFGGRAEVTGFAVADATLEGRTTQAMETLRWAVDTGVPPVLITSALAASLRRGAKLLDAPPGLRDGDLAREVGASPAQLRRIRGQLRGWDAAGLARALRIAAQADADVKGAAADAAFALERAVLAIGAQRARR